MREVVLYGGTGLARMLRESIEEKGDHLLAIIDDTPNIDTKIKNVPVFQGWENFVKSSLYVNHNSYFFMLAIGNPGCGKKPFLFEKLLSAGLKPYTIIHHTAFVADDAVIGPGTQVDIGAIVMAQAVIGKSCIIGPNSNIAHDAIIGDFVDTTVGVIVCGHTIIRNNVLIGAGAKILPRLIIGNNVTIGTGAVVTKNIPDGMTVIGIPAREYIKNDR